MLKLPIGAAWGRIRVSSDIFRRRFLDPYGREEVECALWAPTLLTPIRGGVPVVQAGHGRWEGELAFRVQVDREIPGSRVNRINQPGVLTRVLHCTGQASRSQLLRREYLARSRDQVGWQRSEPLRHPPHLGPLKSDARRFFLSNRGVEQAVRLHQILLEFVERGCPCLLAHLETSS